MEARISELEIKISFAEDMIDGLNRTVYRQQQQIDRLLTQVETLRDQVQAAAPAEQRILGHIREQLGVPEFLFRRMEQLAGIETLVGMASGKEKAPGVAGALRTGVLDVLVIDEALAHAVLTEVG